MISSLGYLELFFIRMWYAMNAALREQVLQFFSRPTSYGFLILLIPREAREFPRAAALHDEALILV